MKELLQKLELDYAEELRGQIPLLEQKIEALRADSVAAMPTVRRAADGKAAGTINHADMKVLYLLVRHFKPKAVFEIGTWVGTSAMVMAEAIRQNGNGGIIYTCDTADCYLAQPLYQNTIKKITAFSDVAIEQIPADTNVDFVFADGELTFETIKKLNPRLSPHAIITTHDYILPAEKGVINYLRLQLTSCGGYNLVSSKTLSQSLKGDTVTAIIYRDKTRNILSSLLSRAANLVQSFFIGVRATLVRIYRKCTNYYKPQHYRG